MTRDEIMLMAREADGHAYTNRHAIDETAFAFSLDRLERFSNLVAEKEREACAQIGSTLKMPYESCAVSGHAADSAIVEYMRAIRARGQK